MVTIYLKVRCHHTENTKELHACSILATTPRQYCESSVGANHTICLFISSEIIHSFKCHNIWDICCDSPHPTPPPFIQIDAWFHRAQCFNVPVCTTSRLMGTQPETVRQSWNILPTGAPRLINGTLDSMINTCASSYYKKLGGNLRWPGIDPHPPCPHLPTPHTIPPSPPLPCPLSS